MISTLYGSAGLLRYSSLAWQICKEFADDDSDVSLTTA